MKKTIGVLTPLIDGFYFNEILQGIHFAAEQHNVNILIIQTMDSKYSHITYNSNLAEENIDGWIIMYNGAKDAEYMNHLEQRERPVVSSPYTWGEKSTVFEVDNEHGGYEATKHLIEHGHREIACVYTSTNEESIVRYKGYLRAMQEANIPCKEEHIYNVNSLWEFDGVKAAYMMQERGFNFTAVSVSSDLVSLAIIEQLQKWRIKVPEDIAVVGFDNIEYAKNAGLTSVEQPLFSRGKHMLETLCMYLSEAPQEEKVIREPTTLVVRNTCGCTAVSPREDRQELYNNSLKTIEYLHSIVQRNNQIGRDLVRSEAGHIKNLSWLGSTGYTWGCLAIWLDDRMLKVEGLYSSKKDTILQNGQLYVEKQFPPQDVYTLLDKDEVLSIHTIKTEERELGFVLLIGKLNEKMRTAHYKYDTISHSLDLLAYAVERDAMNRESQRQREELIQSERSYRMVVENVHEVVFRVNPHSQWVYLNPFWTILAGYSISESLGHNFINYVHPDDQEETLELYYSLINNKKHHFYHGLRILHKDGYFVWVEIFARAIRNTADKLEGIHGTIRNITEQKEKVELEKYRMLGEMASAICHEIRNPLTSTKGFLQLLKETYKEESTAHYFVIAMKELERAEEVLNDYLNFSRPQINRTEKILVSDLVKYCKNVVGAYAISHKIEIEEYINTNSYIRADMRKLSQALINMMKNSVESMLHGGILSISTKKIGRQVHIDIQDTGIGMNEEQISRIGEPFYSMKEKGTGMGLMISYQFIRAMDGEISVKSKPGYGTKFSIIFPEHLS